MKFPTIAEGVVVTSLPITPFEGFLVSRMDGRTTVEDIADSTGASREDVQSLLEKLEELGAVAYLQEGPPRTSRPTEMPPRQSTPPPADPQLGYDPKELEEEVDLPTERKEEILRAYYGLGDGNHYEVLGVAPDAPKKDIRNAYFALSKRFHPDTLFGKNLGSFQGKMEAVFKRLTEAYEVLGKKKKRAQYDQLIQAHAKARRLNEGMADVVDASEPKRKSAVSRRQRSGRPTPSKPAERPAMMPPPQPSSSKPPQRPISSKPPQQPISSKPPQKPISSKPPQRPISSKPPQKPISSKPPQKPVSSKPPQKPISSKPPQKPISSKPPQKPISSKPAPSAPAHGAAQAAKQLRSEPPGARTSGTRPRAGAVGERHSGARPRTESTDTTRKPSAAQSETVGATERSRAKQRELQRRLLQRRLGVSRPATKKPSKPADRKKVLRGLAASLKQSASVTGGVNRVERHLADAAAAEKLGDIVGAVNALRLAMSMEPDREDIESKYRELKARLARDMAAAYERQAHHEEQHGQWLQAARSWEKVFEGRPTSARVARRAAAALLEAEDDLRQARNLAQRAVELAPRDVESRVLLGRIFVKAGMTASAKRELQHASKLDPTNDFVKNLLRELK